MINVNNTAINIATGLDRVKLRVEFFNSNEQSELIIALKSLLSDGMKSMYFRDNYSNNSLFINGYCLGNMYLSIIGSCYSKSMFINKKKGIILSLLVNMLDIVYVYHLTNNPMESYHYNPLLYQNIHYL